MGNVLYHYAEPTNSLVNSLTIATSSRLQQIVLAKGLLLNSASDTIEIVTSTVEKRELMLSSEPVTTSYPKTFEPQSERSRRADNTRTEERGRRRNAGNSKSDSQFHLLADCPTFHSLRTLDLSDNDICDLVPLLEKLKPLNNTLTGLLLEGNPCYTCVSYKNVVLRYFPHLLFLDNTGLLISDRIIRHCVLEETHVSAITFTCHRVIALPQPPKMKGIQQMFHFEITLPLLEEITIEPEPEPGPDVEMIYKRKDKKANKSAKGKKLGPYDAPDEYENECMMPSKNKPFKTERFPWSKNIQLPEQALIVESPEQDLTAIRDTFRSVVNVKFIYQQILPPQKAKKEKGKKAKEQKNDKKKGANKSKIEEEATPKAPPPIPQEQILKKITLANFFCELHSVNWSDRTVDFYWADHPKTNPNAIAVEGSLRAINYVKGKPKPKKEKKGKSKEGDETDDGLEVKRIPSKQFLPEIFTCQVGFGLLRSYNVNVG